MRKKLLAIGVGAVLAASASAANAAGLTLTSNAGAIRVYCNGTKGPDKITSSPLNLPWILVIGIFNSTSLQCQFYPAGDSPSSADEIGSANLNMTLMTGQISNVQTYNGYAMPTIAYQGNGPAYTGISVTLNPK